MVFSFRPQALYRPLALSISLALLTGNATAADNPGFGPMQKAAL